MMALPEAPQRAKPWPWCDAPGSPRYDLSLRPENVAKSASDAAYVRAAR